jgi:glycosyltransferase involved in cell wall biosynthesis
VRLVLVGDGPLRRTLEEGVRELELEGIVEITGLVDAEEVRRRVMAARAFVLASLTEGLPVSIMEALALGRPVIATNVGAIAELVRNGETGWLVSPGNSDLLAEAMIAALRTPDEVLAAMGRRGAALVGERHRGAHEIPKLEDLLVSSAVAQQRSLFGPEQGH